MRTVNPVDFPSINRVGSWYLDHLRTQFIANKELARLRFLGQSDRLREAVRNFSLGLTLWEASATDLSRLITPNERTSLSPVIPAHMLEAWNTAINQHMNVFIPSLFLEDLR